MAIGGHLRLLDSGGREIPPLQHMDAPAAVETVAVSTELEMILRVAADPTLPVEKLERLLAMHERMATRHAKEDFDAAFAVMAAQLPTVVERAETNNGTYATLEDIVEAVRPVLSAHGFAISHKTEWPEKNIVKIIGILTHRGGHSRESEFISGADVSGNKNAIQGLGSAVSYGRRYTTKDLLNIVTRKEDDDGHGSEKSKLPAAPKGYDDWWTDMTAVADEGFAKLEAAWERTPGTFKAYVAKNNRDGWNALKAKALKVKS